jgi:hypothetical protein
MCINEIIFLPVLRDFTSFNIRFYFLLFAKVNYCPLVQLLALLAVGEGPGWMEEVAATPTTVTYR